MSRLQIPLLDRLISHTGDRVLRGEVQVVARNNAGVWIPLTFRADSATEVTTMPATLARQTDLPMPLQPIRGLVHQPTGLEIRSGFIRVRVVGMDQTEYVFPCYFIGDPDVPISPASHRTLQVNLLGLTGVVNQIRLIFDGTPTQGAQIGNLIVEKV